MSTKTTSLLSVNTFPSKTDICWEGTVVVLVVASFVPPIVRGTLEEGGATMERWGLESSPF